MHPAAIDPAAYSRLLSEKAQRVSARFSDLKLPSATLFPSPPTHFRMRAEFRVWHDGDSLYYAMFDPAAPRDPIRVDIFRAASEPICALMPRLRDRLAASEVLRQRLFQVEFLSTLSGEMLVTLIYHRPLDVAWQAAAEALAAELDIRLIGRSRKQKIVLDADFVNESLALRDGVFHYRQYEGGFTQPNARINIAMLDWVADHLGHNPEQDLLELYCGNGNFTAALAGRFRRVLATEIAKTSVRAAEHNFHRNQISNVTVLRMASEELSAAFNREREFRRLQDIDLDSFALGTVLVDPPRAGLDPGSCALISGIARIVYISCNPETLHRDLQLLTKTHRVLHFAQFDQFPYTDHMECGVILQRRGDDDGETDTAGD